MRDPVLEELLSRRGTVTRIAEACGITTAAVSQWRKVPFRRVAAVSEALGVPAVLVRPDLHAEQTE